MPGVIQGASSVMRCRQQSVMLWRKLSVTLWGKVSVTLWEAVGPSRILPERLELSEMAMTLAAM
jgi:hypothetical protein